MSTETALACLLLAAIIIAALYTIAGQMVADAVDHALNDDEAHWDAWVEQALLLGATSDTPINDVTRAEHDEFGAWEREFGERRG